MSLDPQDWGPPQDWDESRELWLLNLLWPVEGEAQWRAAMHALDQVLSSRRVVAAVRGGYLDPSGLNAVLMVARSHERVVLHDAEGQLAPGLDPVALRAALTEHVGALIFDDVGEWLQGNEEDEDAGDADVVAGLIEDDAATAFTSTLAVHLGEDSAEEWGILSHKSESTVVLHGDAAVIHGPERLEHHAVDMEQGKVQALSLRNEGRSLSLSYYSVAQMQKKLRWYASRKPLLEGTVGIAVTLYPPPSPVSGVASGAPWTPSSASQQNPAQRLAMTLADVEFLPGVEQMQDLAEITGPATAARIVTALRDCALGQERVPTVLEGARWLPQLETAVSELGFDPQWVRVAAGAAAPPDAGVPVKPLSLRESLPEWPGLRKIAEEEFAKDVERQAGVVGWRRLFAPLSWRPGMRVGLSVIELVLGTAILVFQPLPWPWVNYVAAGLLVVEGVGDLWLERNHRRRLGAPDSDGDPQP